MKEVEYEIRCNGEFVAGTWGHDPEALLEAKRYAEVYSQDGVTEIWLVEKRRVF